MAGSCSIGEAPCSASSQDHRGRVVVDRLALARPRQSALGDRVLDRERRQALVLQQHRQPERGRPDASASARAALAIGPSLSSMLSGSPITRPTAWRSRTARPSRSRSLAAPARSKVARAVASRRSWSVPARPMRRFETSSASSEPRAGSRAAKAAALSHTVKACSFRGASRPARWRRRFEPGDFRACRSTRPPWPASPRSHGSRCRRTHQERLAGELSQIVQLDRAAGRGRHRRRRADALGDAAAAALARRRGQRRRAPGADPGQRAQRP